MNRLSKLRTAAMARNPEVLILAGPAHERIAGENSRRSLVATHDLDLSARHDVEGGISWRDASARRVAA